MQDGRSLIWEIYTKEVTMKANQVCEHPVCSCSSCANRWGYCSQSHSTIPLLQVTVFTWALHNILRDSIWVVSVIQSHFIWNPQQLYSQHCQEVHSGAPIPGKHSWEAGALEPSSPPSTATLMVSKTQQLSSSNLIFIYVHQEFSAV